MLKHRIPTLLATGAMLWALAAPAASAADFSAGSTGADGALDVTESIEIVLPPDGILNYTTVTLAAGVSLTFKRNNRNTPVFMLAQGDIVIGSGAEIIVNGEDGRSNGLGGRGGPGGFAGGSHLDSAQLPGTGQGPGAPAPPTNNTTWGPQASYGTKAADSYGPSGPIYGTQLLMPLIGGSGGAAGNGLGGGGGGGAILLASDTRIAMAATSAIQARGVSNPSGTGSGSGGAIRLVAPIVEGSGQLDVSGYGGGAGRARVDTLFNTQLEITRTPGAAPYTIGSMMLAFLDIEPQIEILGVGQTTVPGDHDGEFLVLMPSGSGTDHDVTVRLTDFTGTVPIRVTLTPEVGATRTYDTDVDMSVGAVDGSKSVDVAVSFPLNISTFVHVWTRPADEPEP